MQPNGATIWARKTIHSDIFLSKPDKWFKIWFFIVNRVNFKDNTWKRGECFITTGEIEGATRATPDQVKKCLSWLRESNAISTNRSTRGMHLKVLNYNTYQDLKNYTSTREAPEKHQRSTTIVEEGKNERTSAPSAETLEALKETDMTEWKKYNENQHSDDIPAIDAELNEEVKPAKKVKEKKVADEIQQVFDLFNNDASGLWRMREIERVAAKILYEKHGIEKLKIRLDRIEKEKGNKDPHFPLITTPSQLLDKMANVERYFGI